MELSTLFDATTIVGQHPLAWIAIVCAAAAAVILAWYLIRRPPLDRDVKAWLFLGIGVFPIGAAGAGNIVGFQHTMTIDFCAGCHVMTPYTGDARNSASEDRPSLFCSPSSGIARQRQAGCTSSTPRAPCSNGWRRRPAPTPSLRGHAR